MDELTAAAAFRALAQPTRLDAFRLIVAAGADGLPAGWIAERLGVPHNTLSTHLARLQTAGLVTGRQDGRRRRYAVAPAGVRALTQFLMAECCGGRPEICLPTKKREQCA